MNKQVGGPAFPSHGTMGEVVQTGMSLRDYFAAKAFQGLLSNPAIIDDFRSGALENVAERAVSAAGKLLEALDAD